MDDWLYRANQKWMGGNVHAVTQSLLANHTSWMMISERLANIFAERYAVKPARLLAIHNPVNMEGLAAPALISKKTAYTMAYAGALWQMHFDAFLVIAKAVQLLQKSIAIRLVVYTSQSNWQWRHEALKPLNVEYGGHIPYVQIHSMLAKADCFLLTSSFSREWQTHTKASVQTKLTDYLKAGRLIISCGPSYSANHEFLKKYNCGICIETDNEQQAAGELEKILNNIEANQAYVQQGYAVLQNELCVNVVHERLKQFLVA
jgi:glycosyltransferase involved in cell wall biosynthesis